MSDKLEIKDPNAPAPAPEPGTPEYDAAMAAKMKEAREANKPTGDPPPPAVPEIPEGGAEKFYDKATGAYNWEAHAKEAEYKLAQKPGADEPDKSASDDKAAAEKAAAEKAAAEKAAAEKTGDEAEVTNIVEAAGLKVDDLKTQLVTNGKLDDGAREALIKQGLPADLVDDYCDLAKFRLDAEADDALKYVGGEEAWTELQTWASQSLPKEDVESYNKLLDGPDWKVAVDAMKARKAADRPLAKEGDRVEGGSGPGGEASVFKDQTEQTRAINKIDPDTGKRLYDVSPDYRAKIEARIKATSKAARAAK